MISPVWNIVRVDLHQREGVATNNVQNAKPQLRTTPKTSLERRVFGTTNPSSSVLRRTVPLPHEHGESQTNASHNMLRRTVLLPHEHGESRTNASRNML